MSTNVKKISRFTATVLCLVVVSLFVAYGCEKEEDYDAITYYDAVGIGYVFRCDVDGNMMHPIQDAEITVTTSLENSGSGLLSISLPKETFTTDVNGKYQVRFIKRTKRRDTVRYIINMEHYTGYWGGGSILPINDVKNAKHTILLDTIKSL